MISIMVKHTISKSIYQIKDEKRQLNRQWLLVSKGSDFGKFSSRLREALSSYHLFLLNMREK